MVMRKVSLKLKKFLLSGMIKMRVFIDNSAGELKLHDKYWKELGILKGNDKTDFEINNGECTVMIVYSKLFPENNSFMYNIPAGEEDYELFVYPYKHAINIMHYYLFNKEELLQKNKSMNGWE
jgi:hypothetical protein